VTKLEPMNALASLTGLREIVVSRLAGAVGPNVFTPGYLTILVPLAAGPLAAAVARPSGAGCGGWRRCCWSASGRWRWRAATAASGS
jgi:hypothetical protein